MPYRYADTSVLDIMAPNCKRDIENSFNGLIRKKNILTAWNEILHLGKDRMANYGTNMAAGWRF